MKTLLVSTLLIAACASETPIKQDTSVPQFDTDDAKEDSSRKPSKGIDMRIGQLVQDGFTHQRGYISHELRLEAGKVDIDLAGEGVQLDTVLYVFGPKKANGKFPTTVLAFNDDFDYPVNLGSHIVLDVAQAGSYRIVVSTYDNYINYPYNPSVADYRLSVKCQNAAFGACGPAVSDIGGTCWEDDECLAFDGSPLHCEGEVTCAPGTNCFFARSGSCVVDYAYMTYAPVQCGNPWSQTVADGSFAVPELGKVKAFYGKQGIVLDEIGTLSSPTPTATCSACGCPRGDEIVVKLSTPMAEKLAAQGWIYSSSNPPARSIAPKQCGSNPWQSGTSVASELANVDAWLASQQVTAAKRGFMWPAEPQVVCLACSCPRGDRLVEFAKDQQADGILSSLGFNEIYVP